MNKSTTRFCTVLNHLNPKTSFLQKNCTSRQGELISTSFHILDTQTGFPASDVMVNLYEWDESSRKWEDVFCGRTDDDGRISSNVAPLLPGLGVYKAIFETERYFQDTGVDRYFYPEVEIKFIVETSGHYHIPLLISPYGYSTYRGS
eukprot:TRINITY_DN245_c0_g1_i4.p1 TRINITY_DN245_c0_g1~~TRINITY_DN245_c0_g1_i4.p1  ORF type:complete len:147 (-),score=17.48 TRINITY_DN245_c0_g1_i4:46-486(-)